MSGPRLIPLPSATNKEDALKVIDALRAQIESGEAVGFWGVTINQHDEVASWSAAVTSVSRLRGMGAVSHLLARMHAGDA